MQLHSVKLQLFSIKFHQNQKQIERKNYLQTLYQTLLKTCTYSNLTKRNLWKVSPIQCLEGIFLIKNTCQRLQITQKRTGQLQKFSGNVNSVEVVSDENYQSTRHADVPCCKTPVPIQTLKLSSIWPGQYLDERPVRNSQSCWHGFGYQCCLLRGEQTESGPPLVQVCHTVVHCLMQSASQANTSGQVKRIAELRISPYCPNFYREILTCFQTQSFNPIGRIIRGHMGKKAWLGKFLFCKVLVSTSKSTEPQTEVLFYLASKRQNLFLTDDVQLLVPSSRKQRRTKRRHSKARGVY